MKELPRTEFGDPILRKVAKRLTVKQITSAKIQTLIADMRHTLTSKKLGVGLAAPQVGQGIALAVITIRPTKHRPSVEPFDLVIINPEITDYLGKPKQLWEGCLSSGDNCLFGKVPRHNKIAVKFYDQTGQLRHEHYSGLAAQAIQHETDHLYGILFVDKVADTKTYMTMKEYKKRVVSKRSAQ